MTTEPVLNFTSTKMKAPESVIEIVAGETIHKNTVDMTFDERQDFIFRLSEQLKKVYLINHLRQHGQMK